MTADLFAQFREVPEPEPPAINAGVYLLLDGNDVIYVGSSSNVPERVCFHAGRREFDRSLWLPLPVAVLPFYEGALIRAFKPRDNLTCPASEEHDAEILDGLGLGHLTTDGWREHFRAARARERQRWADERAAYAAQVGDGDA